MIIKADIYKFLQINLFKYNYILLIICFILLNWGCNTTPSDKSLTQEISEYSLKCSWKISSKDKDIYEKYEGKNITIDSIIIKAKSFKDDEGSVKFQLNGKLSGKPSGAWYGFTKESANPYLSDKFKYEGEWNFKKYDSGWKIQDKVATQQAFFYK